MNGIHRKIIQLRVDKNWPQKYMAKKLGLTLKTYQYLENGIIPLEYETLKEVSEVLAVDIEDLINSEDGGVYITEIKKYKVEQDGQNDQVDIAEIMTEYRLLKEVVAAQDEQIAALVSVNRAMHQLFEKTITLQ